MIEVLQVLAVDLFRAQKASARAKLYRGGIRGIEEVRALMTRAERRSHPEFELRSASAHRAI